MKMTSDFTAVLFSGGRGSRLFPINEFYQKVMMPIGKYGTPMLELVIRHLKHHGIENFVALVGYKGNQIRRYFGDGSRFGINIDYSNDLPNLKGTGGALYNARDKISTNHLLIYYTDILTSLNFSKLMNTHLQSEKQATVWLDPNWPEGKNSVRYDTENNAVHMDRDMSEEPIFVNTGIACLKASIFSQLEEVHTSRSSNDFVEIDLSSDLFSTLASEQQMQGYLSDEWWLDIGSISRLSNISESLLLRQLGHLNQYGVL